MSPAELVETLRAAVALGEEDHGIVFTFVGPTSRGLGVRVQILATTQDGERVMAVDRKTAKRWLAKIERELAP